MAVKAGEQAQALRAARSLAQTLRATRVIQAYLAAEQGFRTNSEVERLRGALTDAYQAYLAAERDGHATVEQIHDVRRRQAALQAHPAVLEFVQHREAGGLFLQRVNGEISALLGLDFGATVGPAGGAC